LKHQKPLGQQSEPVEILGAKPPVIHWRIPEWFKDLSSDQLVRLQKYHTELCKFNKSLNLVSSKSLYTADAAHFADAVLSFEIVYKNINKNIDIYDIGSGNGFPGLAYSALDPSLKVVLVDSDQRKCEFLKHAAAAIGLTKVTVQNIAVERIPEGSIEQAIARGFAPLPRGLLVMRKAVSAGGAMYHLKSEEWSQEVSQIPSQLCSVWQPTLIGSYQIPTQPNKMHIIKTAKIA
jgi:16S rRNA (guanine527-N7)-methyltransferase